MDKFNENFAYNIEELKSQFQSNISSVCDFEKTFESKYIVAKKGHKTGIFISNHEFECVVKLYRSIQSNLIFLTKVLVDSAKHEKLQTRILESVLEVYISQELKKKE